jgi:hypothetical protein
VIQEKAPGGEDGQASLEMVASLLVVMSMMFWLFELSLFVTAAASASLHDLSAMTVTVAYANGTAAVGNPVTVKVAYTYVPYVNLPGMQNSVIFISRGQIVY